MKTIQITLITAACLCALGSALADSAEPRSRADVLAELNAARADGTLSAMVGEDSGSFRLSQRQQPSTTTRAQVIAELHAARSSGETASLVGEDSGSFLLARAEPSSTTRAQVIEALKAAIASGEAGALIGEDSGASYLAHRDARDRAMAAARSRQQQVARVGSEHQAGD